MSTEQSWRLATVSIEQAKSKSWRRERKPRTTSTKGHRLKYVWVNSKGNPDDPRFLAIFQEKPQEKKKLAKKPQIIYGNEKEPLAKIKFSDVMKLKVCDIGLVCKEKFSWFGGSPDGMIRLENGDLVVLEIKCLYSYRDDPKIGKVKCLNKAGKLKTTHPYYTQIQLNCWVTGAKYAYLFLFTDHDYKTVKVDVDEKFA